VNDSKIYIGTSGWSYPKGEGTWKGFFYPSGRINELEYYSQFFNSVEINSSFYRPPNPEFTINWVRRTPENFKFTIKLWQKFTHPKMYLETTNEEPIISKDIVDLFKRSIDPLIENNKLGAILAQFPASFRNNSFSRRVLGAVIATFDNYPLAVELRHRSWSDDDITAEILNEADVSWVQIDEPKFSSSIATEVPLTSNLSYFRFHGRNAKDWWQGNNETRYRYLYSIEEIRELTTRVKQAARVTNLTFAFFNNHWQAYAPRNAVDMQKALNLRFKTLSNKE
jgi:uncharacterized protein YecE (DUF72 family)